MYNRKTVGEPMPHKLKKAHSSLKNHKRCSVIDNDSIYNFFSTIRTPVVWILVLITNICVYVSVGLIIDYLYPNAKDLQSIHDVAEIVNGINVWIIFIPLIWAYYRWLPESAIQSVTTLEKLGIISSVDGKGGLLFDLHRWLSNRWIHVFGGLSVLASFLYMIYIFIPSQNFQLHMINFWYYTKWSKTLFFILYIPVNYALFVFLIRLFIIVIAIYRYFGHHNNLIKLYPLHPDKCGGMGEIGFITSRMVLLMVVFPVWITVNAYIAPIIAGGGSQVTTALIVYAFYIVIVPLVLFFLLWRPHKAMEYYKRQQLMDISTKLLSLQDLLTQKNRAEDWDGLKNAQENYRQVVDLYDVLNKQIPIWPISLPALRQFSAFAGSPVVVGLITFGIDLLVKPKLK
jgi:hypothetical protein